MKTSFQEKVFTFVKKIPRGKISTYKLVAKAIGKPKASRAVGNTLHKNKNLVKVPCYRVVKSNGFIGNYVLGQKKKVKLLKKERLKIKNKKIIGFEKKLFI